MDGFINAKIEKQTIYEIYRACRLCGAGAGYKMPIIQNVVNLNGAEVELKQKISECVQIEVHQDDKMPPLICELCVDKVNDFYEFLEMCRHTNKRTRLRLGLPPQTMPRGAPDAGDCILGVTEPVFINEDSAEHTLRSRNKSSKSGKRKTEDRSNISNSSKRESRDSRDSRNESRTLRSKQPSPPRLRGTKRASEVDNLLSNAQKSKKTEQPKSILKKTIKTEEEDSYLMPRTKRSREREVLVKKGDNKRVKLLIKPMPPRSSKTVSVRSKSPPLHRCQTCNVKFDNHRALNNHMRIHQYAKQPEKKPIKKESKDIRCTDCKKTFPRKTLLNIHKCPKQGGDCSICKKHFYSQSSLIRHRSTCVQKKKEVVISPKIRRILKPLRVLVSRCDPLLENVSGEHFDVSNVAYDYGLDKCRTYPYISTFRVKSEPGYMVNINDDIRQAFDADKYVHWDSEDTDSDAELEISKSVDSLTSLTLKTLFSNRMIGKVPKKRRKVKAEKAFDSILNVSEFDSELNRGINDIIDSLDDTIDESIDKGDESIDKIDESVNKADESFNKSVSKSGDNDSLFGDENAPTVTNDDFDSLFDKSNNNDNVDSKINNEVIPESNSDVNEDSLNDVKTNDVELDKQENSEVEKDNSNENTTENNENSEIVNSQNDSTDVNNDISGNAEEKLKEESESNSSNAIEVSKEQNTEERSQIHVENEVTQSDNSEQINDTVVNEVNVTENNDSESTNENKDDIVDDKAKTEHVNGNRVEKLNMDDLEDWSEGEMDDKRLMEALDAQIGENESDRVQEAERVQETEREEKTSDKTKPASIKSADLESISDDDFNLND